MSHKRKHTVTKTHNVKSRREISNNKVVWDHHGVVFTDENGYQRVILNTLPVGNGGPLTLYLFPDEKKS